MHTMSPCSALLPLRTTSPQINHEEIQTDQLAEKVVVVTETPPTVLCCRDPTHCAVSLSFPDEMLLTVERAVKSHDV